MIHRRPLPQFARRTILLVAAGLTSLGLALPGTAHAKDFHNIHFKVPPENGAARQVLGTLGGDDDLLVRFFDAGTDMAPAGPGHAWLAPLDGTFDQLCITSEGDTPAMIAIQMNLHASGDGSVTFTSHAGGNATSDLAVNSLRRLADNTFTFDLRGNGQNRITFELPDGSPFTQLDMQSDVGIENIRQVRVAVLPEPVGLPAFALATALLLRRRRR